MYASKCEGLVRSIHACVCTYLFASKCESVHVGVRQGYRADDVASPVPMGLSIPPEYVHISLVDDAMRAI
jgi:hypothetical protein